MSYILEALQKSERKRQKDSVPDLQAVHVPDADKKDKRPLWPWLLVVVLIVNAVLLATFLPFFRDDGFLTARRLIENQEQSASPQDLAGKSPANKPTAEPFSVKSDTLTPATAERLLPAELQTEKPVEINSLSPEISATHHPVATEQSPHVLNSNTGNPLAVNTVGVNPSSEIAGRKTHTAGNTTAAPVDILQPTDLTEAEDELIAEHGPIAAAKEIPLFGNLPQSLRQHLPELSISFLAYSRKPSERIVSINGRIMREGQTIADDLTLEKITSAGAVLNYRGDRFLLEVF
jgi:general secretion pathway protein B